jgi:hypothetical protein
MYLWLASGFALEILQNYYTEKLNPDKDDDFETVSGAIA